MNAETGIRQAIRRLLLSSAEWRWAQEPLRGVAARVGMPAGLWRRLPVSGEFRVHGQRQHASFVYASSPGDAIGRILFWQGLNSFEPETIPVFVNYAMASNLTVDVGANTGIYTLLACAVNPQTHVIAVEPVPHIHDRLLQNVAINAWGSRCTIVEAAATDTSGTARFHVPNGELPTSASLHQDGFRDSPGALTTVRVTTLDDLIRADQQVDLVKIDVEGFEDRVLAGMSRILSTDRPALIIECNRDGPVAGVNAALQEARYRVLHLRGEGPVAINQVEPDPVERWRNFLCLPKELPE